MRRCLKAIKRSSNRTNKVNPVSNYAQNILTKAPGNFMLPNPMRPSKIANLMNLAEVVAERSHDAETHVGALLVSNKTGAILATGFNGFVRGANDAGLPNTRPDKYPYMVHAEQNLIANCARHGISMDDCTVVCTHSPCVVCMRLLFQCGITEVLFKISYTDSEKVKEMKDIKIIEIETEEPGIKKLRYEV